MTEILLPLVLIGVGGMIGWNGYNTRQIDTLKKEDQHRASKQSAMQAKLHTIHETQSEMRDDIREIRRLIMERNKQ